MRKILLLVIGVLTASLVVAFFILNSYRSRASFNDNRYKGLINTLTATPIPKSFLSSDNAFLTSVVYTQPHGAYGRAWHYLDERRLDEDMERIKALGFDSVIYWGVNLQSVWKIDYDKLKNQAPYPTYFQVNETELGKLIHFMDAAAKYNLKVNLLLMGGYEEPLKPDPQQPSDWGGKAPGAAFGPLVYAGWPDAYNKAYADFHRFLAERLKGKNLGYMWIDDELFFGVETDSTKWTYMPRALAQSYFFNTLRAVKQANPSVGTVLAYLNGGINKINYASPLTYGEIAVYLLTTIGKPYSAAPLNKYYDGFTTRDKSVYAPYANALCELGIECNGTEGKPRVFNPNAPARREGAATWLLRSKYGNSFNYQKTPYFKDVPSSYWAFSVAQKMKDDNLEQGDKNGNFRPTDTITLGEFAQWLMLMYPQTAMFKPDPSVVSTNKDLYWVPGNFADTVGFDTYWLLSSKTDDKMTIAMNPSQVEYWKKQTIDSVRNGVSQYEPNKVPFFIPEGAVRDFKNDPQLLSDAMSFYLNSLVPLFNSGSKKLAGWNYFTFRDSYAPSVNPKGTPDECREDLFGLLNINNEYKSSTVELLKYFTSKGKYTYAYGEPNHLKSGGFEKPVPNNIPACYGTKMTRLNYIEDQTSSWKLTNAVINDNSTISYEGYGSVTIQPQGSISQDVQMLSSTPDNVYSLSLFAQGTGGKMEVSILKSDGSVLQTYTKSLDNPASGNSFNRYEQFLKLPQGSTNKARIKVTAGSTKVTVDNLDYHIRLPSSYR